MGQALKPTPTVQWSMRTPARRSRGAAKLVNLTPNSLPVGERVAPSLVASSPQTLCGGPLGAHAILPEHVFFQHAVANTSSMTFPCGNAPRLDEEWRAQL